jgi:hypothetical protein
MSAPEAVSGNVAGHETIESGYTQNAATVVRRPSSGMQGRNATVISPRLGAESPRSFERRERDQLHVRKTTSVDDMMKKTLLPEGTS